MKAFNEKFTIKNLVTVLLAIVSLAETLGIVDLNHEEKTLVSSINKTSKVNYELGFANGDLIGITNALCTEGQKDACEESKRLNVCYDKEDKEISNGQAVETCAHK